MKNLFVFIVLILSSRAFAVSCKWTDKTTYENLELNVSHEIQEFSSKKLFDNPPLVFDLSKFWGFECASYQVYSSYGTIKVVRSPHDQSICSMGYAAQHELIEFTPIAGLSIDVKDNVLSKKVDNLVVIGITCE